MIWFACFTGPRRDDDKPGEITLDKRMTLLSFLALALVAAALSAAYIRLAPSDAKHWHRDVLADRAVRAGPCADQVQASMGGAHAVCLTDLSPQQVLTRLDAIATATPRTMRLAGDPASGRITWITRSALWGFPDYTTAQARQTADGTRLDILARLRFGQSDLGVNAARLRAWLRRL